MIIKKIKSIWWRRVFSPIYSKWLRCIGVNVGKNVVFWGVPLIEYCRKNQVYIGNKVILCSKSDFTALGVRQPMVIRALTEKARIYIGDNVGLSGSTICAATEITIAADTLVGANVSIVDTDFHPVEKGNRRNKPVSDAKSEKVVIGENVFIGTGSVVLKGGMIGANSVIGALSLVTGYIPNDCVAVGTPAKVIRKL